MAVEFPSHLFISGTDTGIGKTVVAAILMAGLSAEYWKPIQSGTDEITDTQWVREKSGLPEKKFHPESYLLKRPMSPHASAAEEGIRIDIDSIQVPEDVKSANLIIEGAGGIMVPINEHQFMLDLMKKMGAPILLVTSSRLGTINHTLLSLEQLRRHGLDVFGVVINGVRNQSNRQAIEHYGRVEILAEIESIPCIDPESLVQCFHENFQK
ncbi:MAG: dethiobiotin synthase [Syntrophales bacterium]|jgi:dethiobiotin synthase